MSIDYIWNFGPVTVRNDVDSLNNVVVGIAWRCTAKDPVTDLEASETGYTEVPNPDPTAFINLENLKKDNLLSWVGTVKRQEVENACAEYLNNLINPKEKEITLNLD